ncbi:MAG: hypothetical protein KA004_13290 [Verrucomicrobiales bacterium]|nr:hypothetical protein [Verrucomicrobiales bacterium]
MNDSQPIDLSELQQLSFRPSWASAGEESDASGEITWNFSEGQGRGGRGARDDRFQRGGGGDRGRGGPRRDFGDRGSNRGPRRDGPGGPRTGGREQQRHGAGPRQDRGPRPADDRRRSGPQTGGGERPHRGPQGRGDRRDGPREHRFEERPVLPVGWYVRLLPEPRAVEALSKQIKASGRAYSVFDVAKLFLSARDRYLLHFYFKAPQPRKDPQPKGPAPTAPEPATRPAPSGPVELIQCALDGSLWLTREEALRHCRESGILAQLYREEIVETEAPKGNYTAVAVCGFSGTLLGPPNHHAYQPNVARLHREKFSNLPLDRYKSRIRIEKDPEIVKKWMDQQSKTTHYIPVRVAEGEEAPVLKTLTERDAHFFKSHAEEILKTVREATVPGSIPGRSLSLPLLNVLKMEVDRQNRFPMHLVQELCRELENHGLRFFKRDRKTTFVCRSRPHFIGDNIVLSNRVRSIIEMVRANPGIAFSKVVATLAPSAPPVATPTPAEGEAPATAEPAAPILSTEELAIMQDLKWLVQEGYITEFSGGDLHILGRERPHEEEKPRKDAGKQPLSTGTADSKDDNAGEGSAEVSADETATAAPVEEAVPEASASVEAPASEGTVTQETADVTDAAPAVEAEPELDSGTTDAAISETAVETAAEPVSGIESPPTEA